MSGDTFKHSCKPLGTIKRALYYKPAQQKVLSQRPINQWLREQAKTSSPGTQQKPKDTRDVNPHLYTKEGKTQDSNSLKDIKFNSKASDMQIKLRGP